MKNKRLTIGFVLAIGIGVHWAVIWGLNNLTLKVPEKALDSAITMEQTAADFLERQQRTEVLAEIFDQLDTAEPEVKQQFNELRAEYAPSIEIALASDTPVELSLEPFAFEPSIEPPALDEAEIFFTPGTRLITNVPEITTVELPPLAELEHEDETYQSLGSLAGSELFDISVEYAQKRHRPGYIFKATLHPKEEVAFRPIRQNIFFLLDRSNALPRTRFALNKSAVSAALAHLKEGDTFNILLFDNKIVRLAPQPVAWNQENVEKAREFLENQGHGGHFAATELYSTLDKIIPNDLSDHEVNTAILLSHGDTYLPKSKQRRLINAFTHRNNGKLALYTLASGSGNNLPLLDLISSFNQGELLYTQDHNNFEPMLTRLIDSIKTPIGHHIVPTAVTTDTQTTVFLQPRATKPKALYKQTPYVVYGSTAKLDDFVLFLQGKYYDKRFDIKKKVSFKQATLGSFTIEKKWSQLLALEYYAGYLDDGNIAHLHAAQQLLAPLNIPVPWLDQ